jgi:tellurite resistance protein TerC
MTGTLTGTQVIAAMAAVALPMLVVDLLVGHRTNGLGLRAAAAWSSVWVLAGVLFGLLVIPRYADGGPDALTTWFTAYTVEKSLSIDNVFLWLLVFSTFAVPRELQRRVLLIGVLTAIALRSAMIITATSIIQSAGWVLYVAGAFLVVGAVKLWREGDDAHASLEDSFLERQLRRLIPTTDGMRGERFFVREGGRLLATPLLFVLILVEASDVVLALDALPAALSLTTDPVMIVTAHTFALLGLRSLFWLVSGVIAGLTWMKRVVAVILAWIGVTIIAEHALASYPLSTVHSLVVIVGVITFGFVRDRSQRRRAARDHQQYDQHQHDAITHDEEVDA